MTINANLHTTGRHMGVPLEQFGFYHANCLTERSPIRRDNEQPRGTHPTKLKNGVHTQARVLQYLSRGSPPRHPPHLGR